MNFTYSIADSSDWGAVAAATWPVAFGGSPLHISGHSSERAFHPNARPIEQMRVDHRG